MKRLVLLAVTVFTAFCLSACGHQSQKKVDTTPTPAEQSTNQPAKQ